GFQFPPGKGIHLWDAHSRHAPRPQRRFARPARTGYHLSFVRRSRQAKDYPRFYARAPDGLTCVAVVAFSFLHPCSLRIVYLLYELETAPDMFTVPRAGTF